MDVPLYQYGCRHGHPFYVYSQIERKQNVHV